LSVPDAEARPRRGSRVAVVVAVAVVIAAYLVLVLLSDLNKLREAAASVHPAALLLPLLLSLLSYATMARSYQGIADVAGRHLSFREWLRITFVSNTANNLVTSAGLSGFAVRMLLLSQQGVSSGRAVLISLVQTFLTNFTLLIFILGGMITLVVRKHIGGTLLLVAIAAVVGFALLLCIAFVFATRPALRRRTLVRTTLTLHAIGRRIAPSWTPRRGRLGRLQRNLDQGLDFLLRRKERMVVPTGWILFDWVLTVGVLWASFWAVEAPLPLSVIMMGFGVGLFVSLVSFVPGGLGIMEGAMTMVFVKILKVVTLEKAFVAVLIFRLTYQVVPLVVSLFLFHGLVRQALRQVAAGSRG
jgi:glycosyltransferase 2 family protein